MSELEAVGDVATGALLGRAAEPAAGQRAGHSDERNCLNCGCLLLGGYCHSCGQKAHVHRTLRAFGHDLLHGALHFEGKIWKTLPMLVWKPGELTRRYIQGERAKFVSPIALFLFIVFLTFAVMGLTGSLAAGDKSSRVVVKDLTAARVELANLRANREKAVKLGTPTAGIDADILEAREKLASLTRRSNGQADPGDFEVPNNVPSWFEGFVAETQTNPELLFYRLKTNAYKFSWALIPISVPFVWLLFPFSRRFRAYDHTVFITYSLCFMMLLLLTGSLLALVFPTIATLLFFVPPFHMYRQLRGAYELGKWGALWRTGMLTGFAFAAIGMFVAILVGAGA